MTTKKLIVLFIGFILPIQIFGQVCGLSWDRPNGLPGIEKINLDGIGEKYHIIR
jgi:hypothetical protein